jgi:hypothetical protein
MAVYLKDIPVPEAKDRFRSTLENEQLWGLLGKEVILLDENAIGRVTDICKNLFSSLSCLSNGWLCCKG